MMDPVRLLPDFSAGPGLALALLAPLYALGAVALTWPLALQPGSVLPGGGHEDLALSVLRWKATQDHGLDLAGLVQDPSLQLPFGQDLLVRMGLPLDALLGLPLLEALDWPLGFSVSVLSLVALAGLSAAWLAGRWTGSLWAALLAGAAWQASTAVDLHLVEGRPHVLLALALLPVALGSTVEALSTGRLGRALLAGLSSAALLALWTPGAVIVGLFGLLALGLRLAEPRTGQGLATTWRALSTGLLTAGAALLLPLSWTASSRWLVPGSRGEAVSTDTGLVQAVDTAVSGSLLGGEAALAWLPSAYLGLLGLGALALGFREWRRLLLPLVGAVLLGLLALGPSLGPVPGPFRLLQSLPGAWWAPVELLAGLELCLALLAAIALRRLPVGFKPGVAFFLGLGLVGQVAFDRGGPFPTTWYPRGGGGFLEVEGPVVWVPAPGGPEDPLRHVLLDAARYDVDLVNPSVPPELDWTSDPVARAQARRYGPLSTLARIGEETEPEGLSIEALGLLTEAGAAAIVIDHQALSLAGERGERARARLREVVGPPVQGMRFQVVELDP